MTQTSEAATPNPTQVLVDLCLNLADGDNSRIKELSPLVSKRSQEMSVGLSFFLSEIEKKGEQFENSVAAEIENIEENFGYYEEALRRIEGFLTDKDVNKLRENAAQLEGAAINFRLAMQRYEEKLLSFGSSRFPQVNFLSNLVDAFRAGKTSGEALQNACDRLADQYRGVVAEIDASPAKEKPGVPERRAASMALLGLIENLPEQAPKMKPEELKTVFDSMTKGLSDLQASLDLYHQGTVLNGPTPVLLANLVLNAAQAYLDGNGSPLTLSGCATGYLEQIRKANAEVQKLAQMSTDAVLLKEETLKILETIEMMDEALSDLAAVGTGENIAPEEIKEWMEQVKAGAIELHSSKVAIETHNENEGKVMCPHCGSHTASGSKNCQKCGRTVPQIVQEWTPSRIQMMEGADDLGADQIVVTARMQEIYDIALAFVKGNAPAEKLEACIDESWALVEATEEQLDKHPVPEIPANFSEGERELAELGVEASHEAIGIVTAGAEQCKNGLAQMRQGLTGDHHYIEVGLREFLAGMQHLLKMEQLAADYNQIILEQIAETKGITLEELVEEIDAEHGL